MPSPPDYLVEPTQLSRFGVPAAFLAQFDARPLVVQITTGGALGVMAFAWQFVGDVVFSDPIASTSGSSFAATIDGAFIDLAFATGSYVGGTTYAIDTKGAVTPGAGAFAGLSATPYDMRRNACSSVTAEALMRMQNAVTSPLLSWGDDARTHAGAMVYAILKRSRGATPEGVGGDGDMNIFLAEKNARDYFDAIGRMGRPPSMTDSSATTDGPLLAAYPTGSGTLRGW
jgi:hypothetical protein